MAVWVRNAQLPGEVGKAELACNPNSGEQRQADHGGLMTSQHSPGGKLQVHCLRRTRLRAIEDTPAPQKLFPPSPHSQSQKIEMLKAGSIAQWGIYTLYPVG